MSSLSITLRQTIEALYTYLSGIEGINRVERFFPPNINGSDFPMIAITPERTNRRIYSGDSMLKTVTFGLTCLFESANSGEITEGESFLRAYDHYSDIERKLVEKASLPIIGENNDIIGMVSILVQGDTGCAVRMYPTGIFLATEFTVAIESEENIIYQR